MLSIDQVIETLLSHNYSACSGVPCSFLKPVINGVIDSPDMNYVGASSEGEAVGISLGTYLAGKKTITMCQNSGFGNMVNPLTSLNYPFRIPTLLVVTWRGQPGIKDEPQHEQMGAITPQLFKTLDIPWEIFPDDLESLRETIEKADRYMQAEQRPFGLLMKKGTVSPHSLLDQEQTLRTQIQSQNYLGAAPEHLLTRTQVLETLLEELPGNEAVIATTGKTGRELFEISDRPNHLYVVGGMGTASAIGLGISHSLKQQPTVVIDGDGAALMKLGNLSTIGQYQPKNLLHVVLDNSVHDSTGGQKTSADTVDFAAIAAAANYRSAVSVDDLANIRSALNAIRQSDGPHFVHIKIKPGSPKDLGRPTIAPQDVKARFMDFLSKENSSQSQPSKVEALV